MKRDWSVMAVEDLLIEIEWEGWNVQTSWPRRGGKTEVVVVMSVRFNGMGGGNVMYRKRINVMSSSAMSSVITDMNRLEGVQPRPELMFFMSDVAKVILQWYEQGKAASKPDPTKVQAVTPWLMHPIWPATGVTGIAAAPGTYKSFMAQAIALSLHYGTPLLTNNTRVPKPAKVLYLDWEADGDTFARRLGALQKANGLPLEPVLTYKPMTTRLADAAVGMKEMVQEQEFDGLIVDSMSASIGAGMVDDDAVNGFYDGIHQLGVPVLVLAHKSVANNEKRKARFFGSGMSEARVRMAWNAEATEDKNFVKWECFKDNNHGLVGSELAWEVEMESKGKHEDRRLKRVSFLGTNPKNVMLDDRGDTRSEGKAWHQLYYLLLGKGPHNTKAAAAVFGVTDSTIRGWMNLSEGRIYRNPAGDMEVLSDAKAL